MKLQVQGRAGTGRGMFGSGVTDSVLLETAAGSVLLAGTDRNGGLLSFAIRTDGTLDPMQALPFAPAVADSVTGRLALAADERGPVLFVGGGDTALIGYRVGADGQLGDVVTLDRDTARDRIAAGDDALLRAWSLQGDAGTGLLPTGDWQTGTVGLHVAQQGDSARVLALSGADDNLAVMARDGSGTLTRYGAIHGLGIAAPTALEVVETDQGCWAIVAGAESGSLSVLELQADGTVRATDHVLDTLGTRFAGVQALASVRYGAANLVVAGGSDQGLTLFLLSEAGRLIWLDSLADPTGDTLYNITTLSATVTGDTLVVTAGSQRDPGLAIVTAALDGLGLVGEQAMGGPDDDILIATPDTPILTGGGGAGVFVLRMQEGPVMVSDFQPGLDRLDLSDLPMLRAPGQLDITPTVDGALIGYRGFTAQILSFDGMSLSAADLFGATFPWPDRLFFVDGELTGGGQSAGGASGGSDPPAPLDGPHVLGPDGAGLGETMIVFQPDDGGTPVLIETDAAGGFTLPDNAAGTLDLTRFHTGGDPAITAADALEVLRMAVGLAPSFGAARPQDFIAADIDGSGQVTAADALGVLRHAVGLDSDHAPHWVFVDSAADLNGIDARNVAYETGVTLAGLEPAQDLSVTGILLGNIGDTA
ncbi:hypothetical protein [Rhodovulum adriaticum]|uniref:Uncharacterized protein n=1 Tax=Rhodovulum adriaticum TaxID=35804 RepID=A0A4R2P0Y7_RHOAD|nr:hypothetical protein [Rhodovulum adriaticum]MBK1634146.1 hypothetical protein [Rhodovulum adriaticum]TCP27305.1 hypothetical protein EV656_101208 [Rhodovulum adriaticum]